MTVWHVSNITAFCITICRQGRRLSSFNLSFNLFGIIPLEDSTSSIIIVTDLIALLSTCLLGNHHMYQIVGGIRFNQRKEPPINPTPCPYLCIPTVLMSGSQILYAEHFLELSCIVCMNHQWCHPLQ